MLRTWRRPVFAIFTILLCLVVLPAQAQTLDRLAEAKQITIGYRTDAPPFSYEGSDGQPTGYMVDLCRILVEDIKLALNSPDLAVQYLSVNVENRFDALVKGQIDLLCGATTVTLSRREKVSFSVPTFVTGVSAAVRTDANPFLRDILSGKRPQMPPRALVQQALAERRFAARSGTTAQAWLESNAADFGVTETVFVDNHEQGLAKLAAGEVDAYFSDQALLLVKIARSDDPGTFALTERLFTYEPYGIGMPRGDEDFRLLVDRSVSQQLRSGQALELFAKHLGQPGRAVQAFFVLSALPE